MLLIINLLRMKPSRVLKPLCVVRSPLTGQSGGAPSVPEPGPDALSGAGRGGAAWAGRGRGVLAAWGCASREREAVAAAAAARVQRRGDWLRRAETSGSRGLSGRPARRGAVGSSARGSEEVSSAVPSAAAAVAGLRR